MSTLTVPALTNNQLRASSLAIVAPNVIVSGDISTIGEIVTIAGGSLATIGIQISGTGSGFAITPMASQDNGLSYINVGVLVAGAGSTSTPVTSITTIGNWKFSTGSYTNFQLKNTASVTSGTLTANLSATSALDIVRVSGVGDQADTYASWYTQIGSLISHLKLLIAATVDAGSHTYTYTNGYITSNAWTLFGTTRTRTYTYTGTLLTSQSDWV